MRGRQDSWNSDKPFGAFGPNSQILVREEAAEAPAGKFGFSSLVFDESWNSKSIE